MPRVKEFPPIYLHDVTELRRRFVVAGGNQDGKPEVADRLMTVGLNDQLDSWMANGNAVTLEVSMNYRSTALFSDKLLVVSCAFSFMDRTDLTQATFGR